MPSFLISCELKGSADYQPLTDHMSTLSAVRLSPFVYFAHYHGHAQDLRDELKQHMQAEDGIAVLQLCTRSFDWAVENVPSSAAFWLKARSCTRPIAPAYSLLDFQSSSTSANSSGLRTIGPW